MTFSPHDTRLHLTFRASRAKELAAVFETLPSFSNKRVVSLGCGTAPELDLLRDCEYAGVDHRPWLVPLWTELETENTLFFNTHSIEFLSTPQRIDVLLCLDIDTMLFPVETIDQANPHISPGAMIVVTERAANPDIYGRQLLVPFINEIRERFGDQYIIEYRETASMRDRHLLLLIKTN